MKYNNIFKITLFVNEYAHMLSLFIPQDWRVCGTSLAGKAGVGV